MLFYGPIAFEYTFVFLTEPRMLVIGVEAMNDEDMRQATTCSYSSSKLHAEWFKQLEQMIQAVQQCPKCPKVLSNDLILFPSLPTHSLRFLLTSLN